MLAAIEESEDVSAYGIGWSAAENTCRNDM